MQQKLQCYRNFCTRWLSCTVAPNEWPIFILNVALNEIFHLGVIDF